MGLGAAHADIMLPDGSPHGKRQVGCPVLKGLEKPGWL
jgi:hypothetical protein